VHHNRAAGDRLQYLCTQKSPINRPGFFDSSRL
jgi:hypothetical protein